MRIKKIREDKNITQKELANAIGVKAGTLSRYESGKLSPNADILKLIADYLCVDVNSLYEQDNSTSVKSPFELRVDIIGKIMNLPNEKLEEVLKFLNK